MADAFAIAELEKRYKALEESHGVIQRRLDECLQQIKDMEVMHSTQLAAARATMERMNGEHASAMAEAAKQHTADAEAKLAKQAQDLAAQKDREIAALKQKYLVPAVQDLHARRAADLARQHEAELKELLG